MSFVSRFDECLATTGASVIMVWNRGANVCCEIKIFEAFFITRYKNVDQEIKAVVQPCIESLMDDICRV